MAERKSGVLMPVFSLPGPYGIGDFGAQALRFAERLAAAGFTSWQVLPFTPVGYGNSPYQGYSAYAGNPLFISPDLLAARDLLSRSECRAARYPGPGGQIDYAWLDENRPALLRLAYSRLDAAGRADVTRFAAREREWLEDYALFRTIKRSQSERPWWAWTDSQLRQADPGALARFRDRHQDEIQYLYFLAAEFDRQWQQLKQAVNNLGIRVIGDMPIYVSADSADVWARRQYFEMDASGAFTRVAGVPPDYFTADGQLWGNPLYNWPVLKAEGYDWWVRRIRAGLNTFDTLRIDHFRGFESYWAVPAGEKTARRGQWVKGPAMDLFRQILSVFPAAPIIAEDLGDIDGAVRLFLAQTGLPGMKVMQFAFDPASGAQDRPHQFPAHCVAYSGTHDNTTLADWLSQADDQQRLLIADYCGEASREAVLRCLWQSAAEHIVVPVQDLLGLGAGARINTPGSTSGNWTFRLTPADADRIEFDRFRRFNIIFGRYVPPVQAVQHQIDK